jgi:hypothetical protein
VDAPDFSGAAEFLFGEFGILLKKITGVEVPELLV